MKKDLFIILITILSILILTYLYDKKESITNRELISINPNVHIEYPYFHNNTIDAYFKSLLDNYKNENEYNTFIDYDYRQKKSKIKLIIYIYQSKDHIVKKEEKHFNINLLKESIKNTTVTRKSNSKTIKSPTKIIKEKSMIALIFNEGPNYNTIKVLEILKKYNIKATFSMSNYNIEHNKKIIKKINESNMEINSYISESKLPNSNIIWNIDSLDKDNHSSHNISKRIMSKVSDGDIILMHDIYSATVNSLNILIPELLKQNYQFVTVSELLKYKKMPKKSVNFININQK